MRKSDLCRSVRETLAYASLFSYPLRIEELWCRLHTSVEVPYSQVESAARSLVHDGVLTNELNYLWESSKRLDYKQRIEHNKIATDKRKKIEYLLPTLSKIPWVESIVVTGSVAAGNAHVQDDIDLLVICASHCMWLVRPMLTLLLEIKGVRRRPGGSSHHDKVCLNMFLERDSSQLPQAKQNLYTAYELLQAQCLFDRNGAYLDFVKNNVWAKRFVANWYSSVLEQNSADLSPADGLDQPSPSNALISACNFLLFKLQSAYMRQRQTSESVSLHQAYFHPLQNDKKTLYRFELLKKSIN